MRRRSKSARPTCSAVSRLRQKDLVTLAQKQALAEAKKANAVNRFLIDKFLLQADPAHNPNALKVSLGEALDRAAGEVSTSFRDQPQLEAAVRLALGQTYHELGKHAKSEVHFRKAYDILSKASPDAEADRLRAMTELGHVLDHVDRVDEAEALLKRAAKESRTILQPGQETSLLADLNLADLHMKRGQHAEAEELFRRVLDNAERGNQSNSVHALNAMNFLAALLTMQKKHREAEQLLRKCVVLKREMLGPRHPDTLGAEVCLTAVICIQRRFRESELLARQDLKTIRDVLGPEHYLTLSTVSILAKSLSEEKQFDEAEALYRLLVDARRRTRGPNHSETRGAELELTKFLKTRAKHAARPRTSTASVVAPPGS